MTNFQILAYGTLFLGLGPRNLVDYCYRNNTVYIGQIIEILYDQNHFGSAMKCQEHCKEDERCSFWTYYHHNYKGDEGANVCHLKKENEMFKYNMWATSGSKRCIGMKH